jgi:hypothetical protein
MSWSKPVSWAVTVWDAPVAGGSLALDAEHLRGIWVHGIDGKRYALVANFGETARSVMVLGQCVELSAGEAYIRIGTL